MKNLLFGAVMLMGSMALANTGNVEVDDNINKIDKIGDCITFFTPCSYYPWTYCGGKTTAQITAAILFAVASDCEESGGEIVW